MGDLTRDYIELSDAMFRVLRCCLEVSWVPGAYRSLNSRNHGATGEVQ